jgi:hypothetical protein
MRVVTRVVGRQTRRCPLLVTLLREVFRITTRARTQKILAGTDRTDAV